MQTRAEKKPKTWKRMLIVIGAVLLLILIIAGIKALLIMRMMAGFKPPPPSVVSSTKAEYQEWQPTLTAVGSLRAVRGSDLALDVSGLVTEVNLKSGDEVKEGQVLLQLRDTEDVAQLHQLEAAAALAQVTFGRAKQQLAVQAISQADYDAAAADLKAKQAAVAEQKVNVARKQLRAPFAGRAGIITINPGTYLNSGTVIVTLQQVDPVYVDFFLPQRNVGDLKVGDRVVLTLDGFDGKTFEGTLSAISPKVDGDTRNMRVEATVPNHDKLLKPGMFANVSIDVGAKKHYLTLPQTAIVYNTYGDTVYLVKKKSEVKAANGNAQAKPPAKNEKGSGNELAVEQAFVTTGPTRGDQVAVLKGLDEGAEVVTSGQVKLKNGAAITIDNSVKPADNPNPTPQEH